MLTSYEALSGAPRCRHRSDCSRLRNQFREQDTPVTPASAFGEDAYRDIWTKAAALLQPIVNNHPLVDGNKRLGWLATAVFLELNDQSRLGATNDAVHDLVIDVAAGSVPIAKIAARLGQL